VRSPEPLRAGDRVRVRAIDGLTLDVVLEELGPGLRRDEGAQT